MSSPLPSSPASANAPVLRNAVPPYAAPAPAAAPIAHIHRVGPFVPAPWRAVSAGTAAAAPAVDEAEAEALLPVMEVPDRIPPYRPLRPTPIMTPAMRTPLYIPSVASPLAEAQSEAELLIEPALLTTSEFAAPLSLRPTLSSIEAVAISEAPEQATVPTAEAGTKHTPIDAPAPVTPPASTADGSELPWIEAFLAATPVVPMRSVPTPLVGEAIADHPPVETPVAPLAEHAAEEWPLVEAAAEFQALSAQLESHVVADAPEALFAEAEEPAALPAWGDDDLMDIMPIRHSGMTPLSNAAVVSDGDLWAERARKAQEDAQVLQALAANTESAPAAEGTALDATAEEAAHALEVLARRVRAGELMLPGYDPRQGETAALVAALAALLGVRLR